MADPAALYERGICRGWKTPCGASIQPLGPSSRCDACDQKYQAYRDSNWGLKELVEDRLSNEHIGLCFHCGGALGKEDKRLCALCDQRSDQGHWVKEMYRKSSKIVEVENPYTSIWDANDTGTRLTPTLDTMGNRILATAQYHQRMAERGGPQGDHHAEEATWRIRISKEMQEKYRDISRHK